MTPDEIICTTCEDEGAVTYQGVFGPTPRTDKAVSIAVADSRWSQRYHGMHQPWQVDTCPECGRGREVGRL